MSTFVPLMELIINGRFLTQQVSGVQAFARELCREIRPAINFRLIVPENAATIDDEFSDAIIRYGKFGGHLWEQLSLPRYIHHHPGTILLNLCNTGPVTLKNQVVTIHDLAVFENASWFNPFFSTAYKLIIPRIAKNSKAILTVSGYVKNEIIILLNVPEHKIEVIPNKVSETLLRAEPKSPSSGILPGNYFLMVGSRDPRKNFAMAEKVFAEFFPEQLLVCAGGIHSNFRNADGNAPGRNIIHTGYAANENLNWLYRNACAYINPSLYEGFGIPNLEAMSLGCPVICSDIPVFREICGNAATYFNPAEPSELQKCVNDFLSGKIPVADKTSEGKSIFTKFQATQRTDLILKLLSR